MVNSQVSFMSLRLNLPLSEAISSIIASLDLIFQPYKQLQRQCPVGILVGEDMNHLQRLVLDIFWE